MLRSTPRAVHIEPGGIYVFESRHAPGFEMATGQWPFDKLCMVREGQCSLEATTPHHQAPTLLETGDLVFVPSGTQHRFVDRPARPATLIMVCFRADALNDVPGQSAGYRFFTSTMCGLKPLRINWPHRRQSVRLLLQRMVFEQTMGRDGSDAVLWGLLLQLLVVLARTASDPRTDAPRSSKDEAFAQTLDFIDENFTEEIRIADLASMAGISYRHYTTLFRRAKRQTVNAYVTSLRIDFAKHRLLETGNVTNSGLDAGFGDHAHFYRVFKSAVGLTPRQFIDRNSEQ